MSGEPEKGRKSPRTEVIVALIGLVGVLGGALFANWDKLFPPSGAKDSPVTNVSNTSPQSSTSNVSEDPVILWTLSCAETGKIKWWDLD